VPMNSAASFFESGMCRLLMDATAMSSTPKGWRYRNFRISRPAASWVAVHR